MAENKVKYLVRRLTVINSEGKENLFPLTVISARIEGSLLCDVQFDDFIEETAGTSYFNDMTLRYIGEYTYEVL